MSRWRRLVILVVALAWGAPSGSADFVTPIFDDGNSGGDAPASEPIRLPDFGSYDGFADLDDADAYELAHQTSGAPTCSALDVRSAGLSADATFAILNGRDVRRIHAAFGPNAPARLALASPGSDLIALQVTNPRSAGNDTGSYGFTLTELDAANVTGDGGTSGDVGGGMGSALPIASGCTGGRLGSGASADKRDAYKLDLVAGQTVVVSFAHSAAPTPPQLQVTDAAGAVLATLGQGDVAMLTAPTSGGYFATASTSSFTEATYAIGLAVGPPGSSPCRPNCRVST